MISKESPKLKTRQQEIGFAMFQRNIVWGNPTGDFWEFYAAWCKRNDLKNDNESL